MLKSQFGVNNQGHTSSTAEAAASTSLEILVKIGLGLAKNPFNLWQIHLTTFINTRCNFDDSYAYILTRFGLAILTKESNNDQTWVW